MERSRSSVRNRTMACFSGAPGALAGVFSEIEADDCAVSIERFFPSPFSSRFIAAASSSSSLSSSDSETCSSSSELVPSQAADFPSPRLLLASSPSIHRLSVSSSRGNESRCLSSFRAHHGGVCGVAIDGDFLYSASDDGQICAWRRADALEIDRFGTGSGIKSLIANGGGCNIFSAHHDRKIRAWHRSKKSQKSHKMVASMPTIRDFVRSSMASKNYVRVRRNQRKCLWNQHFDAISVLALGSEYLFSGSWDRSIKAWRLSDYKCVASTPDAHSDAVNALAFDSSLGVLFSGSADGTIKAWHLQQDDDDDHDDGDDVADGRRNMILLGTLPQRAAVNAIAVCGDWIYAACSDGTLAAVAAPRHIASPPEVLRGHSMSVLAVSAAADVVCSGSADRSVRVWRRNDAVSDAGRHHTCLAVLQEYHCRSPVKSVALSLDVLGGCLVYGAGLDGWIKVWWVSLDGRDASKRTTASPSSVLDVAPLPPSPSLSSP